MTAIIEWVRRMPLRLKVYVLMFLVSMTLFLVTGRWLFFVAGLGWQATMLIAAWRWEHQNGSPTPETES